MSQPTVAVVGASANPKKFGNKAVRAFKNAGYKVYPINRNSETIEGLTAYKSLDDLPVDQVDTVTFYVPPATVLELLDGAASKKPNEVWLNPGTATREVVERAGELGLNAIQSCSILGVGESPDRL